MLLHLASHDLAHDVYEFRRLKKSVQHQLRTIPSSNCQRIIQELVEEQNMRTASLQMRWSIAWIDIEWRQLDWEHKQLKKVCLILELGEPYYAEYCTK
jgi:hypothetical protein